MNKNPILNAVLAAGYIVLLVFLISIFADKGGEDTILIPMTMLSLLVLSVAIMGFLFVVEPLRLFLDGQKSEAVTFFGKTLGAFAVIVVLFVILLLITL